MIGVVLEGTKLIESKLELLGATGRGLVSKAKSVEALIGHDLLFNIRKLAVVRAEVLDEKSVDLYSFNSLCEVVTAGLDAAQAAKYDSDIRRTLSSIKILHARLLSIGGKGESLHDIVGSLENVLPLEVVRSARLIISSRNKLVHELGYEPDFGLFDREIKNIGGGKN